MELGKHEQFQQVRGQVVELGTARHPAERGLDPPAERHIGRLANHCRNSLLRLVADALIRQSRGDGVGRHDPLGVEIDLVVQVEAVDVVVHAVEQMEAALGQDKTIPLPPDEDLLGSQRRGVELGIHRG